MRELVTSLVFEVDHPDSQTVDWNFGMEIATRIAIMVIPIDSHKRLLLNMNCDSPLYS